MRHATILTLLLALTLAGACGGKEQSATATAQSSQAITLSPEQLGELGAQIQKNPDRAEELLTHHGFTPESFERAIRQVTEDPKASRRYAAAYRRASA